MKIIGFTYYEGSVEMVLKGDSCLLVNKKPFFTPDWSNDMRMSRCIVLRVSRLGKCIAAKFADRYYDAVAPGADFCAYDKLSKAKLSGSSWTQATCFDYSLAVGEWIDSRTPGIDDSEWAISIREAIAATSQIMTIRQGDLIYIHTKNAPEAVQRDEIISGPAWAEDKLYCKIK